LPALHPAESGGTYPAFGPFRPKSNTFAFAPLPFDLLGPERFASILIRHYDNTSKFEFGLRMVKKV
jgi:hypothetical protein